MSWNDIETMLSGFAYDAYYNQNETSKKNYFTVFDYAIDQGFAYGSGMGTNHHYGYQVRKIYTTAWLMRDAIYKHPHRDAYLSTLRFGRLCKKLVSHALQHVMNCWIPGIRY